MLENLNEYLPVLIPLVVIHIGLMGAALIHILTHKTYQFGNRLLWIVVSLFVSTIGPVLYFVLGRRENEGDE